MKLFRVFIILLLTLHLASCRNNEIERIQINPHLDIARAETVASKYVEDIRSPNEKYRIIIFDELFPIRDTPKEKQKQVLKNYIEALEKTNWQFFGTVESQYGSTDQVWRRQPTNDACPATIKIRLVDYYKEIGDVYFGIESHDRIQFQLSEDLSKPCGLRVSSKSLNSEP